jgi:hypothetical protein
VVKRFFLSRNLPDIYRKSDAMQENIVQKRKKIEITFGTEYQNELKEFYKLSKASGMKAAALARFAVFKMLKAVREGVEIDFSKND